MKKLITLREYAARLKKTTAPNNREHRYAAQHEFFQVLVQVLDSPRYEGVPLPPLPSEPLFALTSAAYLSVIPRAVFDELVEEPA